MVNMHVLENICMSINNYNNYNFKTIMQPLLMEVYEILRSKRIKIGAQPGIEPGTSSILVILKPEISPER